jgi:hypothetical protein
VELQLPGALILLLPLTPAAIAVFASVGYARRRHSRSGIALACGAVGGLVVSTGSIVFNACVRPAVWPPDGSGAGAMRVLEAASSSLGLAGVAFALLFSISLLLVLKDAARTEAPAEQARQPDAQ